MIKNKIQREIFDILNSHSNWENDKGKIKNDEAHQALVRVMVLCKKIKADSGYESRNYCGHLDYLRCLLSVRKAIIDELYMRACNELLDVVYLYPFTQARILNNVIALLSVYLEDGGDNVIVKKRKTLKKEPPLSSRSEFNHAMDFLKNNCEYEQDVTTKLAVIDYFMSAIKMDIQSDLLTSVFYLNNALEIDCNTGIPLYYFDENGNKHLAEDLEAGNVCIDLSKDNVFVIPWRHESIINSVYGILKYGYQSEESYVIAFYFTEIDFTVINKGRHHAAAAIVQKEGFIRAKSVDIKPLFPHVYTDGREWFDTHTKKSISKLCDFRFGLLFEAAKIRNELLNGKSIDIEHVDDLAERAAFVRSLSGDLDGKVYYRLIDERNYYKYRRDLEKAIASPNENETVIRVKPYDT